MGLEPGTPVHAGQIVVDALEREGVERVFCLPGSHILPLYDALRQTPSIALVTCKQEPNASLMADAHGRLTGAPGVCLLTAGPGGANSIAGVAQAYGAASPVVHITGSVPLDAAREAFHGVDDPDFLVKMFRPVTKWSVRVRRIGDIPSTLARAFHIARSGRPGPVHVEIPRQADYSPHLLQSEPVALPPYRPLETAAAAPREDFLARAAERLLAAERPMLCAGKGVLRKGATAELAALAEKFSLPVIYPQDAMGVIPYGHPLALGHFFAFSTTPLIGQVARRADLLLSVGMRAGAAEMDHMRDFIPRAHLLAGFDEPGEGRYRGPDAAAADPKLFLAALRDRLAGEAPRPRAALREEIRETKARLRAHLLAQVEPHREAVPIHPGVIMATLAEVLGPEAIVASDVGNCQMWARYYLPLRGPLSFLQSGVWNAMSFALPTAIAAKLAFPGREVVALAGDGASLMTLGDFVTACDHGAAVVVVNLNDGAYGQIDRQQKNLFGASYGCGFLSPDFARIAGACGGLGIRVERPGELKDALREALRARKPAIVDVITRDYPYPSWT